MTRRDARRRVLTTSGGLAALAPFDRGTEPSAAPPGTGLNPAPARDARDRGADEVGTVRRLSDADESHDYPAVGAVVQVTVTPT